MFNMLFMQTLLKVVDKQLPCQVLESIFKSCPNRPIEWDPVMSFWARLVRVLRRYLAVFDSKIWKSGRGERLVIRVYANSF